MFQRVTRIQPQLFSNGFVSKTFLSSEIGNVLSPKFKIVGETRNFSSQRFNGFSTKLKNNLFQLCSVFNRQCQVLMAQRMKRLYETVQFYRNVYGNQLFSRMIERGRCASRNQGRQGRQGVYLLGASMFSWQKDNITNEDCDRCVDEMEEVTKFVNHANSSKDKSKNLPGGWESIIDKKHLKVWRKPIEENSHLYEYRVYGSYDDVPARAFFNVQVDLDFWQEWENMALSIDIIDKHTDTGSEIVHWLTKYPYPMYNREYLYVRRYKEDTKRNVLVVNAKAIEHPDIPISKDYVRVKQYLSQMVIKPHSTCDENGFDYILTYFDDPQSAFPSFCYNWLASSGVPDFVERLHTSAQKMNEKMKKGYQPSYIPCRNNNNNNNNKSSDGNNNNNNSTVQNKPSTTGNTTLSQYA